MDVALAMDYLHNQLADPLIHCDLKPSNVLLDLDMTACVGDFGLARFLSTTANEGHTCSASLACLKGSFGYIAPGEYISLFTRFAILFRNYKSYIIFFKLYVFSIKCRVWNKRRDLDQGRCLQLWSASVGNDYRDSSN